MLDIGLPRLDGYEVARLLRQQPALRGVVLVALTGWGQDEDKRRSQEAVFDVHLTKPVDLQELQQGYRPMPILFNEDDHYDFDKPANNFTAAVAEYASWGYFDYRRKGEGFDEGYQSVPVNWKTSSARKRGFFKLLSEMTGQKP